MISFNITGKKSKYGVLKHINNLICDIFYKQIIITLKKLRRFQRNNIC